MWNNIGDDSKSKYCNLTYERMQECTENKADFISFLSFESINDFLFKQKFASIL